MRRERRRKRKAERRKRVLRISVVMWRVLRVLVLALARSLRAFWAMVMWSCVCKLFSRDFKMSSLGGGEEQRTFKAGRLVVLSEEVFCGSITT